MGVFLIVFQIVGFAVGLFVSFVLAAVALAVARRVSRDRADVRRVALLSALAFAVALVTPLLLGALPLREVRPGSDHDILARNMAIQGFAYAVVPGLALLGGAIASSFLCPRRPPEADEPSD